MKQAFKTIGASIVMLVLYLVYVVDRVLLAALPKHQLSFKSWADLNLPENERRFLSIWESVIRVVLIFSLIVILRLFFG